MTLIAGIAIGAAFSKFWIALWGWGSAAVKGFLASRGGK